MEKITRFVCGALLGAIIGVVITVVYSLSSLASLIAILPLAFIFGMLALKYGDEFWRSLIELISW
jgi:uncharacterized membrane protein